jgi:tetratricopeptide (TPR) repeat protein
MSTRKSESGNTARIQWCLSRTRTLLQQLARERDESLTNEAIDLSREALTLSSTESISFQVDAKLLLAFSLFIQFERSGEISLLDEGINIQREALDICPPDHPSRIELCENLGVHLTTRYKYTGDDGDAVAAIETQRETLGMRVKGHPDYAMTCTNLAYALKQRYQNTKDDSLMAESIDLERAALESWPVEHPRRATFYEKFAKSLWARYHTTGDVNLIDEAIYLQRASVSLVQRAEDPYLVTSRGILATFLGTKYTNSGEDNVLAEAIGLVHEVLRSQSPDDSEYTISCGNLANLLGMRYKHTGDVKYLEEAVDLLNKALDSCPLNDSRRLIACGNLAHALKLRYDHTGDDGFVAKAVELHREALALSVEPNTNRASICGELASLLTTRYRRTGDIGLLTESLHLHREGLALYPESHPHYPATCGNLANTLDVLYERTGDLSALEEALSLQRSAMQFCPPGDPQRPYIYHNLANSLRKRSERTGDSGDLVEAATLLRQVINLYPEEHPDRAKFCQALADVLKAIYTRRPDHMLMDEIHDLYRQGLALANIHSQHAVWRYACSLSWVYLHHESRFYNVAEAIRCIYKGLEHEIGDVGVAMPFILTCINNAWTRIDGSAMHTALISVYQRLLRFLPLVANTTLNIPDQVHALKACNGVGYDAFVSAVLADDYASGLEALEMAQGVLWSKYIHYRDPQLQDVPQHLAKELEELLHNHTTLVLTASSKDNLLTTRDVQHSHSARIYALIREIKALPGMDHFMSGDTFQNIRVVSSSHPAVVLVGARGFFYALVLSPETSTSSGHSIISLDLSESELESVYDLRGSERMQRGGPLLGAEDEEIDVNLDREGRGFRMKAPVSPWVHGLKFIWQKIVKPVIEHLGLQASMLHH